MHATIANKTTQKKTAYRIELDDLWRWPFSLELVESAFLAGDFLAALRVGWLVMLPVQPAYLKVRFKT